MKNGNVLTLKKDLPYKTMTEAGTRAQGSTITVAQVDRQRSKVLIGVGLDIYVWIGAETLKNFTQEAA